MFEEWPSVRHLLLFYTDEGDDASLADLQPALDRLQQALPDTRLILWAAEEQLAGAAQLAGLDQVLAGPREQLTAPDPLIKSIRGSAFDAALIFSAPGCSPHTPAYICYLAGIPVRLGQSLEFGGQVLSHRVIPAFPPLPPAEHYLHLLERLDLPQAPLHAGPGRAGANGR